LRTEDRNFSNSEKPVRMAIEEINESISKDGRELTRSNARFVAWPIK